MTRFGIGQAVKRIEDKKLVQGKGKFISDLNFDDQAHMVIIRSPYARAKILNIDFSELDNVNGVIGYATGKDLVENGIQGLPLNPNLKNLQTPVYYPLAYEYVRYVGQPVVAIICENKNACEEAKNLVEVEYEELPHTTDPREALKDSAPVINENFSNNIAYQTTFGDKEATDDVFKNADMVVNLNFHNQRLAAITLEPRGSIALVDNESKRTFLYTSCQNPAGFQNALANSIFKESPDNFRVIVGDVGGGFGMKTQIYPEDAVCCFMARKYQRPVKWIPSRSEDFLNSNHGRDQFFDGSLALDKTGKILGFKINIIGNIGAFATGPGAMIVTAVGPKVITGVYDIPNFYLNAKAVLTNTNVVGAYRGAGRPEAIYLIERLVDLAAKKLNLDPREIRRLNMIKPNQFPYKNPMGEIYDSGNFEKIMDQAVSNSEWDSYESRKELSNKNNFLRGRAVSTFLEWTGVVPEETVKFVIEDNKVKVYTAMQAMGQGIETSYLQILSDKLQITPEHLEIVQGDSDIAQGVGSMGSRSLYIGGSAMLTGSEQIIDKVKELTSSELEIGISDLQYKDGKVFVPGTDIEKTLFDVASSQESKCIVIETHQKVGGPSWPNGCHVCEVEIDKDTGEVFIDKYTSVDDVGTVVNPQIVDGQVVGGIVQAAGQALYEDVIYDKENGQLLTGSMMDYCLPRADNFKHINTSTDESIPCKINPLGAKGVGELGTVGATPTIVNAVLNALKDFNVDDLQMPITPEKICRIINNF